MLFLSGCSITCEQLVSTVRGHITTGPELKAMSGEGPRGGSAIRFSNTAAMIQNFINKSLYEIGTRCATMRHRLREAEGLFLNPLPRVERATVERSSGATREDAPAILSRQKRQLAVMGAMVLAAGLFAIGSYLFSQAKLVDLSVGVDTGPNDETIEVLQKHEAETTLNTAAIQAMKVMLTKLQDEIGVHGSLSIVNAQLTHVSGVLDMLENEVNRVIDGVEDISHLRLGVKLVPTEGMAKVMKKLQTKVHVSNGKCKRQEKDCDL